YQGHLAHSCPNQVGHEYQEKVIDVLFMKIIGLKVGNNKDRSQVRKVKRINKTLKKETNLGSGDVCERSGKVNEQKGMKKNIVSSMKVDKLDQKEKIKINNMPVKSCEVAVLGSGMMTMKVKLDKNDDFANHQKNSNKENNLKSDSDKKTKKERMV
ncbi:10085_t:CDS:2, partial [Dentiscutata erythropus]